jgi:hypothetical protein
MGDGTRYRLRNPVTGREVIREGEVGETYIDKETGDRMDVVAKVLPLPPSSSNLAWSVENLRMCPWCDQHSQRDLNECPTCGRRMDPPTPAA